MKCSKFVENKLKMVSVVKDVLPSISLLDIMAYLDVSLAFLGAGDRALLTLEQFSSR